MGSRDVLQTRAMPAIFCFLVEREIKIENKICDHFNLIFENEYNYRSGLPLSSYKISQIAC